MADFLTMGAVQAWIRDRIADKQIINGHSAYDSVPGSTTNLMARCQRPMATGGAPQGNRGAWVKVYDDDTTIAAGPLPE